MGISNSSQSQQQSQLKINHPKFKHTKQTPENDIIRSIISVQNQSDYQQWQSKLNKITNLDDEVILLPKAYQYTRKAICGSSGTIQIDYDNFPYLLADQLVNRRKQNKFFSQPEIWYLLYSLVTAAYDFQKINQRIGDVRPQNIFINDQGHIKVSNLFSWPGQVSNYVKTVFDNQRTYLSPEETESVREGQAQTFINKYKAQSFTIGLTVLQTAMIRSLDYIYRHSKSFDYQYFNSILKQWWELKPRIVNEDTGEVSLDEYSDALKLTIAGLCEIKPEDRLVSQQIYNWLKVFHKQINQILPFQPGFPPYKNINKHSSYLKSMSNKVSKVPPSTNIPINNQNPNINTNQNVKLIDNGDPRRQLFQQYSGGQIFQYNNMNQPNIKINQYSQQPQYIKPMYNNNPQHNMVPQPGYIQQNIIPNSNTNPNPNFIKNPQQAQQIINPQIQPYRQPVQPSFNQVTKPVSNLNIKSPAEYAQMNQPQFILQQPQSKMGNLTTNYPSQYQYQGVSKTTTSTYSGNQYPINTQKPNYVNNYNYTSPNNGTNSEFLKEIDEKISRYRQQNR